ncbi:MAG: HEPN domain-containing protein [Candidatus Omnitrophota bacterium]|nr:MAG: HEPN domain-containing protein [Candidatus Omnitrophota bacterium]
MGKQKGIKEYVRLRLKLARDKIETAELLFGNGKYRDVISRAYYAIYYAAKAFLLYHGKDPHTHKGVDILFREFCNTHQKPQTSYAKMLSVMREARLNADYREKVRITKDSAQEAIEMAESFLKEIKLLIKS